MKTLEKLMNTLSKNLGLTVVLVAAIVLFAIFSDGLLRGLITAASALIAYTCIEMLYKEFKSTPKTVPAKVKKTAARKKK